MSLEIRSLIVMIAAGAVAVWLSWLLRRARPAALDEKHGAIMPDRWSAWLTLIGGLLMFGIGTWATLNLNGGWAVALVALFGVAIAGFMAPSTTAVHIVNWSEKGIQGPCRLFGPTLATKRTEIAWTDIVSAGKTITGYWYVESNDGRRVYWSYLYKGYGALTVAIRTHCPSLRLPRDLD